ncbi:MAG: zinc-ribbon domain-containing protein [Oscillospiraceae bacterium]|nr:zinc-ribbon domain-containing protein [Oscillospiraceae bacterium]
MKCNKCGAELEEGAIFCGSCGGKVEGPDPRPEQIETPEIQPEVTEFSAEPADEPVQEVPEQAAPTQFAAAQVPPVQPQPVLETKAEGQPVSLGAWVCRYLINFIPCVGSLIYIVMLFVWAFDNKYDETSRNWAKAQLIIAGISIVLMVVVLISMVGVMSVSGITKGILDNPSIQYSPERGYSNFYYGY